MSNIFARIIDALRYGAFGKEKNYLLEPLEGRLSRLELLFSQPLSDEEKAAGWNEERQKGWEQAIQRIYAFITGEEAGPGFSIISSIDSNGIHEGRLHRELIDLSSALRQSGIDRYL